VRLACSSFVIASVVLASAGCQSCVDDQASTSREPSAASSSRSTANAVANSGSIQPLLGQRARVLAPPLQIRDAGDED
jgi:hypothetical protein